MKKILTFGLRSLLCAFIFSGSFFHSYASHIVGGDLYYTYVTGNTYKITIALYGDCGPSSAAAFATLPSSTPQVCIYNGGTSVATITLAIDTPTAGVEITPLCPGDSSRCSSPTSTLPGVKKFVYSTTYTFPYASVVWRIVYSGDNGPGAAAGRAAAITNLIDPGDAEIQLIDTLNTVYNNSNPTLTVSQQTFFCVNQHDTYNPGASDPDSDSLSITLVNAASGTTSCTVGGPASYIAFSAWPGGPAVSATNPLQVDGADSFSMNTVTGEMFFHPILQRSIVVYNIQEYRVGSFVGTSQREMSVIVVSCDSTFPCMYVAPTPPSHVGVPIVTKMNEVKIYPNPATDQLTVSTFAGAYSSYTITNALGRVFLQSTVTATQTNVNLETLPAGLYYLTLSGEQGTNVQKFVKM